MKQFLFLCLFIHMGLGLHCADTALMDSTDLGKFPMGNLEALGVPCRINPRVSSCLLETLLNQLNPPGLEFWPEIPPE